MTHTISLELAQALQAAGVDAESTFGWHFTGAATFTLCINPAPPDVPAYTSDELLALLGECFWSMNQSAPGAYHVGAKIDRPAMHFIYSAGAGPAEALGRLLLTVRQEAPYAG